MTYVIYLLQLVKSSRYQRLMDDRVHLIFNQKTRLRYVEKTIRASQNSRICLLFYRIFFFENDMPFFKVINRITIKELKYQYKDRCFLTLTVYGL